MSWTRQPTPAGLPPGKAPIVLVVVSLACVAVLLALFASSSPSHHDTAQHPRARAVSTQSTAGVQAARRFLESYLVFVYGHAPAGRIEAGTKRLRDSLAEHRLIVTPAMRHLQPRILALQQSEQAGCVEVRATINAGQLIDYTLRLRLIDQRGRLLVSLLEGAA